MIIIISHDFYHKIELALPSWKCRCERSDSFFSYLTLQSKLSFTKTSVTHRKLTSHLFEVVSCALSVNG